MINISLTDFVDFVIRSGSPKLTKVSEIKKRTEYQPAFDFWKPLRDGIISFHRSHKPNKNALDVIMVSIADPKKIVSYPDSVQAYKKFLGRKRVTWFDPPSAEWQPAGLRVRINPELGLNINGIPHVIKLYFKKEDLSKKRVEIVLLLLQSTLRSRTKHNTQFGVLDVQRAKLFATSEADVSLLPLLKGEALNFATIWDSI